MLCCYRRRFVPSVDPGEVRRQYANATNLDARINLHRRYSTNQYGWSAWVFDQMRLASNQRILEVGCGSGQLWIDNKDRVPSNLSLILTDLSEGMLAEARARLTPAVGDLTYAVADAEKLPFEAHLMDTVIANHMLYHVPHIEVALAEIRRVLKPVGTLYCTTNGERYMAEIGELLAAFDERIDYRHRFVLGFTLQNGPALLSKHFDLVEVRPYADSLAVTSADDLINYVLSTGSISNATELLQGGRLAAFKEEMEKQIAAKGSIQISKESGMLVARVAA
jgi:ubiquinone/menaquinone biosynthesis C-methylase UbiE